MGRKIVQHILGVMFAVLVASMGSLMLATSQAHAVQSVPYQMNFQGRLNNASGAPMAAGTYNMIFRIYNVATGGSALWTETRAVSASQGVTITSGGLFSVQLGSVTSLPSNIFNSTSPLYLEVELPSPATATSTSPSWTEGAMGPRNPIVSSPYAINSDLLDGLDSSAFAAASGSAGYIQNQGASPQAANFNITGNGTIGGKLLTPSIDSTGLLAIGTSTATALTLGRTGANTTVNGGNIFLGGNTTVTAGNTLSVQSGYAAITGFNVADSHATLTVNNHSSGSSPLVVQSTDTTVFEVKNDGTVVASNTIKAAALQAASLDTSSAGTLALGSANATSITLGSNTTVGAGKSLTLSGGITSTRPASPTKGMLYYDTSKNQLLQYNGTKWVGSQKTAAIVAASDSSQTQKDAADFVATGTNDQTTIASAISSLGASGGTVYLLPGDYYFGASLAVTQGSITITGGQMGAATIRRQFDGSSLVNGSLIYIDSSSVKVTDLTLDGASSTYTNTYNNGIYKDVLQSAVTLDTLQVVNSGGTGIFLDGDANMGSWGNKVNNTIVDTAGVDGISGHYASSTAITNNKVSGITGTGISFGDSAVTISNNTVGYSHGSQIGGAGISAGGYGTVTGNTVQNIAGVGVYANSGDTITGNQIGGNGYGIDTSSGGIWDVTISGNTVGGNTYTGIHMNGGSPGGHVMITGNTVSYNGEQGIYIQDNYTGNIVSNNNLDGNASAGSYSAVQIGSSTDTSITNNVITGGGSTGYAISNGGDGSVISGNTFSGTGATAIQDTGTGTVWSNQAQSSTGDFLTRSSSDSTTAFQIQNAANAAMFNVDTTNSVVSVGTVSYTGGTIPSSSTGSIASGYSGYSTEGIISGGYIYTARQGDSLKVYNINTPTAPTVASSTSLSGFGVADIAVSGQYAYIIGGSGLRIYNVSNPSSPVLAGSLAGSLGGGRIQVKGSYAFVIDSSVSPRVVRAYDVSNPATPTLVSSVTSAMTGTANMTISGNYLYTDDTTSHLEVYSIATPTSISRVASISTNGSAQAQAIAVNGNIVYVKQGNNGTTVQAYDVSTPSSPTYLGSVSDSMNLNGGNGIFTVSGSYMFFGIVGSNTNVEVFDISKTIPTLVTKSVATGSFTAVQGRYMYLTDSSYALNVYDMGSSANLAVSGQVTVASSTNSATAFQIQNAAGVTALNVDTTTNTITLGSGSNTVTFTAGGGLIASGTARHTKTILLTPEYAGAVLDAASDTSCSSANSGTMISGLDSTNRMNYYNWTSSSASAQCYDVVVQVPIPADFNGWASTPDIRLSKDSTGTASYAIDIIDSTGTVDTNYNYSAPGTLGTSWANMATSAFGNAAGTNGTTSYAPGGYFTIKVRVSSTSSANVKLGNIKLTYSSTF